eukprot:CAMPEP_0196765582 /NCGR_PEP_ID=MMETSP1095-20130614/9815_1 /TAXON_ID=96789 ORGANISM="Chromulina nebulosa, Strain UTEXLB2642" /NCGR_SAMPLE_ID=MMETSP1095 /ASSEMBLY_ACC=CAM_ASM_000446 /LENGTH=98 /DNA_ID=CAMNT_0042123863 /DNA_START=44 /DNA_END=340 /DNA_ORIENTATION=+
MSRFLVIIALVLIASVASFKSPVRMGKVASSAMISSMKPLKMTSEVAVEATNAITQFSQTLAAEGDFGGYAGPAGALIFIGIIILTLSPPLAAKSNDE